MEYMSEQDCEFCSADGQMVRGTLVLPIEGPKSMVLLCHGISTNRHEYLNFFDLLARLLAQRGYGSLRIDFRGHGESHVHASDFTVGSQLLDVQAACDYLRLQGFQGPLDLMGCSFGAAPCVFAKAQSPHDFGRVTLLAPVLDYRVVFIDPISSWGKATFTNERVVKCLRQGEPIKIADGFAIYPRLLASMLHSDIFSFLPKIKDLSIIHGESDEMVSIETSVDAAKRFSNIQLIKIAGMEHGFTYVGDEEGTHPKTMINITTILNVIVKE